MASVLARVSALLDELPFPDDKKQVLKLARSIMLPLNQ